MTRGADPNGFFATLRPRQAAGTVRIDCFEQSYAGVEGDSASTPNCMACSRPGRLRCARGRVTGSVNQHGQVQRSAGQRKDRRFYAVCKAKGLTASGVHHPRRQPQGPHAQTELVEAVRQGSSLWAVTRRRPGIEILTGWRRGEAAGGRQLAEDTVNARVDRRCAKWRRSPAIRQQGGGGSAGWRRGERRRAAEVRAGRHRERSPPSSAATPAHQTLSCLKSGYPSVNGAGRTGK